VIFLKLGGSLITEKANAETPRLDVLRRLALEIADARQAGIASVNLDLLYDVPGQTLASWTDSLERALALGPDHLSLYALILDDPDAEGLTGPGGDHLPTTAGARRWRERARKGRERVVV